MCREIVENVLSGTKVVLKATRNLVFNQKAERSTMNRQKSREIFDNMPPATNGSSKKQINLQWRPRRVRGRSSGGGESTDSGAGKRRPAVRRLCSSHYKNTPFQLASRAEARAVPHFPCVFLTLFSRTYAEGGIRAEAERNYIQNRICAYRSNIRVCNGLKCGYDSLPLAANHGRRPDYSSRAGSGAAMVPICARWLEAVGFVTIRSARAPERQSAEAMTAPRPREQRRPPSPPDRQPRRRGGVSSPCTHAASAAGRPAGPARLFGARRGLARSARALAAAALLALSGALALPATAVAQEIALVSNIGTIGTGTSSLSVDGYLLGAQAFTVGADDGDYTLASIELPFRNREISSANIGSLNVSVWSADSSNHPESSLYTLTNPSSIAANTTATFTAPAVSTLEAGMTYVVVVDYDYGAQFAGADWRTTDSNAEDSASRIPRPDGPSPTAAWVEPVREQCRQHE